jgi:hypothetical protein
MSAKRFYFSGRSGVIEGNDEVVGAKRSRGPFGVPVFYGVEQHQRVVPTGDDGLSVFWSRAVPRGRGTEATATIKKAANLS